MYYTRIATSFMQIMQSLIRCRVMRHLIWVCILCQCPFLWDTRNKPVEVLSLGMVEKHSKVIHVLTGRQGFESSRHSIPSAQFSHQGF